MEFIDASVPLISEEQVRAVVAARASLMGHNGVWPGHIGEALRANGLPVMDWATAVEVTGRPLPPFEWPVIEHGTAEAYYQAVSIVRDTQTWAEEQSPPLCSLTEQLMISIGLGPVVAGLPIRPSQVK